MNSIGINRDINSATSSQHQIRQLNEFWKNEPKIQNSGHFSRPKEPQTNGVSKQESFSALNSEPLSVSPSFPTHPSTLIHRKESGQISQRGYEEHNHSAQDANYSIGPYSIDSQGQGKPSQTFQPSQPSEPRFLRPSFTGPSKVVSVRRLDAAELDHQAAFGSLPYLDRAYLIDSTANIPSEKITFGSEAERSDHFQLEQMLNQGQELARNSVSPIRDARSLALENEILKRQANAGMNFISSQRNNSNFQTLPPFDNIHRKQETPQTINYTLPMDYEERSFSRSDSKETAPRFLTDVKSNLGQNVNCSSSPLRTPQEMKGFYGYNNQPHNKNIPTEETKGKFGYPQDYKITPPNPQTPGRQIAGPIPENTSMFHQTPASENQAIQNALLKLILEDPEISQTFNAYKKANDFHSASNDHHQTAALSFKNLAIPEQEQPNNIRPSVLSDSGSNTPESEPTPFHLIDPSRIVHSNQQIISLPQPIPSIPIYDTSIYSSPNYDVSIYTVPENNVVSPHTFTPRKEYFAIGSERQGGQTVPFGQGIQTNGVLSYTKHYQDGSVVRKTSKYSHTTPLLQS